MKKNKIFLVVDNSGSMRSLRQKTVDVTNSILASLKENAEEYKIRTEVSVILFGDRVSVVYADKSIKLAPKLTTTDYAANQPATRLWDGVGRAIELFNDGPDGDDKDTSCLVIAVTDGGENDSKKYTDDSFARLIKKSIATDRFTITFQVPDKSGQSVLVSHGISLENIRVWNTTAKGLDDVRESVSSGLKSYYNARSTGSRSITNFYVQTDMTKVKPRDVKSVLENVTDEYKLFDVKKEDTIRPFVETKGIIYRKGVAFYQLMKSEKVQANKEVLIYNKASKQLYAGDEARKIIGLPFGGEARVNPGDHAQYLILIQSTSVNRKLPINTKVAVKIK